MEALAAAVAVAGETLAEACRGLGIEVSICSARQKHGMHQLEGGSDNYSTLGKDSRVYAVHNS